MCALCFQFWVVNAAAPRLPLQIEDASRKVDDEVSICKDYRFNLYVYFDDINNLFSKCTVRLSLQSTELAVVNQDTRLDNRILDLRTVTNQAIFR